MIIHIDIGKYEIRYKTFSYKDTSGRKICICNEINTTAMCAKPLVSYGAAATITVKPLT